MPGLKPNRRRLRLLGVLATVLLLAAGCEKPAEEEGTLDTVDVGPGIAVDTGDDQEATERESGIAGILPRDFPSDLSLYVPSSFIDFGDAEKGRVSVTLLSPHRVAKVRRRLHADLEAKGWRLAAGTAAGNELTVLRKGSRRVWLYVEDGRPGTRYRFEYMP